MIQANTAAGSVIPDNEETIIEIPFVNEECGDTMWDAVLKALEEKDNSADWQGFQFSI